MLRDIQNNPKGGKYNYVKERGEEKKSKNEKAECSIVHRETEELIPTRKCLIKMDEV
jgi:hypothetical protein